MRLKLLKVKNPYLHLSSDKDDIADFKTKAKAAICFIEAEHKILLLQNNQQAKHHPLEWGVPGGKMEEGEEPIQTVLREIYEETGLFISESNLEFKLKLFVRVPNVDYELYVFKTILQNIVSNIILDQREHDDFSWHTIAETLTLPLIYGNKELIAYLYKD